MRGSLSVPISSESTSRSASFTRRMRSLIERHHLALDAAQLEVLRGEVALRAVEQADELRVAAGDARERQLRALPDVVVVDLGDRGAEAPLQLRLDGQQLLALALQRVV